MDTRTRWLSLWPAFWLLVTGIPEALPGPRFLPASWTLIFEWLPAGLEWLWPGLFIAAGACSFLGVWSTRARALGLALSSIAYLVWGSTSMVGWWSHQGGTIPGSAAYYLLAGYAAWLAYHVNRDRVLSAKVERVAEIVGPARVEAATS